MTRWLRMPEVEAKVRGRPIIVPEGWEAPVPEVRAIDAESRERLANYFQRKGKAPLLAETLAMKMVQEVCEAGWKRVYVDSIRNYAKVYVRLAPHLWREDGTLAGFDATELARLGACAPRERSPGRNGKAVARAAIRRMIEMEAGRAQVG